MGAKKKEKKRFKKAAKPEEKKRKHEAYKASRFGSFVNRLRSCLYSRRSDAKKLNIEFDIAIEDFEEQSNCKLLRSTVFCFTNDSSSKNNSMSIDRIDPRKGYTKDNSWLISYRANRIKSDATFEEFEEIYLNWKAEIERRQGRT